jgi:tetratricopeptide (TPR) repeat protein
VIVLLSIALLGAPPALEAEYRAISAIRRTGDYAAAAAAFEKLANSNPESDLWQRALATAAAIHQWDLGNPVKAKSLYDRILAGHSARRGVLPALVQRLQLERAELGVNAELELCRTLEKRAPKAEHAPWLLIHGAKILADELDDLATAIGMLERVRREHEETTYVDDALFLEADYLRRLGRPSAALIMYGALIDSQMKSLIVGSYDSVFLDDAFFQKAETLRLEMKNAAKAEKAYLELVERVPNSTLVDDALFQARLLAAARGDTARAVELIALLRKLRPDSRFL